MAKLISTILRAQIRAAQPLMKKMNIESDRKGQDRLGELQAKALAEKVEYKTLDFEGFEAAFAIPTDEVESKAILYLHGGGYVAGSLAYACGFGGILATTTNIRTLCVGYRLAPENTFPAALDDAFCSYSYLLEQGYKPENIVFVGESAGGGLSLCLAHFLKSKGMALPAGIVGISPWTDLKCSGLSYTENKKKDPSLKFEALGMYAKMYAEGQLDNPFVSPIYGDFTDFPPTLVFAGTYELLRDDACMLKERMDEKGVPCELILEEGMWHVYVLFGIPESKEAIVKIKSFVRRCLGVDTDE